MGRAKVLATLAAGQPRILPRGEIWVAPAVLAAEDLPNDPSGVSELAVRIGADLCFFSCSGAQPVADSWAGRAAAVTEARSRDIACGAVVDGPFQRLATRLGLLTLLEEVVTREHEVAGWIAVEMAAASEEVQAWARAGSDMVMLADDLAHSTGLYCSPGTYERLLVPHYRNLLAAVGAQLPLGFHSDGCLSLLLGHLAGAGFTFLSLEPEANDLAAVRRMHRSVTLLSGIPAAWLCGDSGAQAMEVSAGLAALRKIDGLILATSCGLFTPEMVARLRQVYLMADIERG